VVWVCWFSTLPQKVISLVHYECYRLSLPLSTWPQLFKQRIASIYWINYSPLENSIGFGNTFHWTVIYSLYSTFHWINHYPLENSIDSYSTYLLDRLVIYPMYSAIHYSNNWAWGPFLESPETFRALFGWHNSLCILKTKASRGTELCIYYKIYSFYNVWKDQLYRISGSDFYKWLFGPEKFLGLLKNGPLVLQTSCSGTTEEYITSLSFRCLARRCMYECIYHLNCHLLFSMY